ncbi:Flp pilus assembly protein TadB [Virgibacillus natechei]|uniref:Flp pilus assembly protein TadB n=1 Tax=Virgibacillus natechei TaxID=1216297 RepID=A0ABS4ICI6_9BACI|nr:hypothetical protein [Virgibacillus natechei]MBP1968656.1 Flp pilus assembly protein TadB [Virgibacillus natechei]UZD13760.1 hypothetical protein OLD84_04190 [Virgibacillus natechei]
MEMKLIPFYVEANRNRMGYSLFIDMNTTKVYRVYNDNYRFFNSAQYLFYSLGAYWILKTIGGISIHMNFLFSVIILLVLGGVSFWFGNHYLYKKALKKMDLKDVYLTKDEFMDYAKAGRHNARLLLIILSICVTVFLILIILYLAVRSTDLLIILTLNSFIMGGIIRSIPILRLRLNYQNSYLVEVATAVNDKMVK